MDDVQKIALNFVYLSIGSFFGSFLQVRGEPGRLNETYTYMFCWLDFHVLSPL